MIINKIVSIINTQGIKGLARIILSRIYIKKSKHYLLIKRIVSQGSGLEIGGLSSVFQKKNVLPIYPYIKHLDNCNFSHNTVWEDDQNDALISRDREDYEECQQYILEATDLHEIKSESYDFLLSSHMIEHTANPIKALKEWIRIVKREGYLIVLIPHKDGTFDHNRPTTSLDHLIQDYQSDIDERDLTHLYEILSLHDLELDPEAGTHVQFAKRAKNNYDNRCLHHHVFDSSLAFRLFDYMQLKIIAIEAIAPLHILVIAQKPQKGIIPDNRSVSDHLHTYKWKTPFTSDKI